MKWLNGYRMRLTLAGFVMAGLLIHISMCQAAEPVWRQRADIPTPRQCHSASVIDGKIYVIGGWPSEPVTAGLADVEVYDPVTNTWTRKADMPTARGLFCTSVVNGKIYAIGGWGDTSLSVVEEYDPDTDTWTRKADMPTPRDNLSTSAVNGKIYAIGGATGSSFQGRNIVEEYDPETDTWTRKTDKPTGVWGLFTCVVDGKIYAIGGTTNIVAGNYVEEYNPETDTWIKKTNMLTNRRQMAAAVLDANIYAFGGWPSSGQSPYAMVHIYDPTMDTWSEISDMPINMACFSASSVNNRIYVIGGTPTPHPTRATSEVYEFGAPLPDFNGDHKVDPDDMHIMVDHWGENYPLCDISPTPLGDGIVDIQDMIMLAKHLYRLTAHWKLDETDGTIAYDSFGDHDGTLNGNPLWLPTGGMIGGALLFDGVDDFVDTPFILNPGKESFSVFAWIKCWTPGQVIISQTGEFGETWLCIDPTEGTLMTRFSDTYFGALESESVITDMQWHHIGFVYDLDTLHRRLYVDGVQVAEDATVVSGMPSEGGLYIGASKDLDPTSLFSGFIDDVRIYNQALSAEEIAALAQ